MKRNPIVDRWFRGKPAEPILRRVRDVIMSSDSRRTEYLKHGTVQFAYKGDMANFIQLGAKTATLMFNRGAKIRVNFPHLEGTGPSARFMRFADLNELEDRTVELNRIVVAWCEMMSPPRILSLRMPKRALAKKKKAAAGKTQVKSKG